MDANSRSTWNVNSVATDCVDIAVAVSAALCLHLRRLVIDKTGALLVADDFGVTVWRISAARPIGFRFGIDAASVAR